MISWVDDTFSQVPGFLSQKMNFITVLQCSTLKKKGSLTNITHRSVQLNYFTSELQISFFRSVKVYFWCFILQVSRVLMLFRIFLESCEDLCSFYFVERVFLQFISSYWAQSSFRGWFTSDWYFLKNDYSELYIFSGSSFFYSSFDYSLSFSPSIYSFSATLSLTDSFRFIFSVSLWLPSFSSTFS